MKRGFTLVEILVAIIILSIGILAVSQMTVMGMRTSTVINRQMYARDVLNRYYEVLQGLPTYDSILTHQTSANLDDTSANCDFEQQEVTAGGTYRVVWNVRDNCLIDTIADTRFKAVRIHVIWAQGRKVLKSPVLLKPY